MIINEQETEALILLQRSIVSIRNLALKKTLTPEEVKQIMNLADACHNVPYCFLDSGSNLKLEEEVALMRVGLRPFNQ